MFDLPSRLDERSAPARVGILGAGQFGTKCLDQLQRVPGLDCVGIADPNDDRVSTALAEADIPDERIVRASDPDEASTAIDGGDVALVRDGVDLARATVDIVVEATGDPVAGARHAYEAVMNDVHVVMATCEADAIVGPLLGELAETADVRYTPAYGDQPALLAELVAWAETCGFDVVAGGRGIDSYDANAAIELCVAANVTGLPPDTDGLHVPSASLSKAAEILVPQVDGGILRRTGVIDGLESPDEEPRVPGTSIADGVFVVVTTPNEDARSFIRRKNRAGAFPSEDGRHLTFFRPHHLPGPEATVSVASVADNEGDTGAPRGHIADVVAIANRSLKPGTTLSIDRTTSTDLVEAALRSGPESVAAGHVPYGLLDGSQVTAELPAGTIIGYDDVELESTFLHQLRGLQDQRFG